MPELPISLPSTIYEIFPKDIPQETALTNAIRNFPDNEACKKAAMDYPLLTEGILQNPSSFNLSIDSDVMEDAVWHVKKVPDASDTAIAVVALLSEYGGKLENANKYLPKQSELEPQQIAAYNKFFENISTGREKFVSWVVPNRENRNDKLKEVAASIDSNDSIYYGHDSPEGLRKKLVTPDDQATLRIEQKSPEIYTETPVADTGPISFEHNDPPMSDVEEMSEEKKQKNDATVNQWNTSQRSEYLAFEEYKEDWDPRTVTQEQVEIELAESRSRLSQAANQKYLDRLSPTGSSDVLSDVPTPSNPAVKMGGTVPPLRRSTRITARTEAAKVAALQSSGSSSQETASRQGLSR